MRIRLMTLFFFILFFLLIDFYFFQGILAASKNWSSLWKGIVRIGFWVPTLVCILALVWWTFGDPYRFSSQARNFIITGVVATYFTKILGVLVLFIDDLQRGLRWLVSFFTPGDTTPMAGRAIPR